MQNGHLSGYRTNQGFLRKRKRRHPILRGHDFSREPDAVPLRAVRTAQAAQLGRCAPSPAPQPAQADEAQPQVFKPNDAWEQIVTATSSHAAVQVLGKGQHAGGHCVPSHTRHRPGPSALLPSREKQPTDHPGPYFRRQSRASGTEDTFSWGSGTLGRIRKGGPRSSDHTPKPPNRGAALHR